MTPESHTNLVIRRGIVLAAQTYSITESGAAKNLTGWSAHADARSRANRDEVAFDLAPTITNAAGGIVSISMTTAQTTVLTPGWYTYDLVLENSSGERFGPYAWGSISVEDLNTQPE